MKICEIVEYATYCEQLAESIRELGGGMKVLRLDYESSWQGHVDIDILLNNGRVFSYIYYYGSCSGCDEWEGTGLTDKEIVAVMLKEATIFDSEKQYSDWRRTVEFLDTCCGRS